MSSIYDTPEWSAWLASIREMPDDDSRRLIAADFLEDNGESERSEFIRVQIELAKTPELVWRNKLLHKSEWEAIRPRSEPWGERFELASPSDTIGVYHYRETNPNHAKLYGRMSALADGIYGPTLGPLALAGGTWVVERGFVSRVSGPLASLHGGECRNCVGRGNNSNLVGYDAGPCPQYHGTGRTPGVLGPLLRREPVEMIEVTDREPDMYGLQHARRFRWVNADRGDMLGGYERHAVPEDVFRLLQPQYDTTDAARLALSRALYSLSIKRGVS